MTGETVRISGKNQIVIPKSARKKLSLSPGDELVVHAENGVLVMNPKPRNYTQHLQGLHKEVWQDINVDAYIEGERKDWPTTPSGLRKRSETSRRSA
jgi:AbrB family looped-hinge helix DNA binding protein